VNVPAVVRRRVLRDRLPVKRVSIDTARIGWVAARQGPRQGKETGKKN
jgi:hypothetical protein